MPDPIETYLDELMRSAHLPGIEASRIRSELREHIHQMLAESEPLPPDPKEALLMLHDHFGEPGTSAGRLPLPRVAGGHS
ncbi:MAG TPA: hypothetical protein VN541_23130 [Tepidisphaeraceae bacterium]|nr:hypothetical protein [Tepidisphaeraceae bacterium]